MKVQYLLTLAATAALASSLAQAQLTWNGSDMTWQEPDADSFDNGPYESGNDVFFNGTGPGTVTVAAGGVTPGVVTVSSGTYLFTGAALADRVNASSWTLSGGVVEWTGNNRLGTGPINVTGNATIKDVLTSPKASTMGNSAVNVSNGVVLTVHNSGPNSTAPNGVTLGPVTGTGITLKLTTTNSNGRVRLSSSSTFSASTIEINSGIAFENVPAGGSIGYFGAADNKIVLTGYGSLASFAAGGQRIDQNVEFNGLAMSTSNSQFHGSVTRIAGSVELKGTTTFNNSSVSLADTTSNNATIRFNALPTSGGARADGKTNYFVGDNLTGNLNWSMNKNFNFNVGASNDDWMSVNVGTNSNVTMTKALGANSATRGGFRKDGVGTLNLSVAGANIGAFQVRSGRMNVSTSLTGATDFAVQNGATLGGSGSINFGLATGTGLTVASGGTLAPGTSIESLALTGAKAALTLDSGSTFAYEVDSSVAASAGADLLTVAGNLSLSGTVTLTLSNLAGSPTAFATDTVFTLINYSGTWNNGLFTYNSTELANNSIFSDGLNTWRINYDALTGGQNFTGDLAGSKFVNITAVSGPSNETFAAWAASQSPPVTGGPNGDDDNDGVENLVEYALADGQERGSLTGSTLSFTKRGAPWGGDITLTIETSDDLGSSDPWQAATPDVDNATTISYTLQNPGDNFARLKVSQN